MEFVANRSQLLKNIARLSAYLSGSGPDREFGALLVARGKCFVVTEGESNLMFAPSRFVGYASNNRAAHRRNGTKDGRLTNPVIERLLEGPPQASRVLEAQFSEFCRRIGVDPNRVARKYWDARGQLR